MKCRDRFIRKTVYDDIFLLTVLERDDDDGREREAVRNYGYYNHWEGKQIRREYLRKRDLAQCGEK